MQRSTFKVFFYVKRQSEKHGQVPVMGRITINGTMSQFSYKDTKKAEGCKTGFPAVRQNLPTDKRAVTAPKIIICG